MEENQRKKFRKTVIGIGSFVLLLAIVVIVVIMSDQKTSAGELAEQLDLGEGYLSELNYEQAIIAYQNAIEIDPRCVEAYIGLADVYIAMGEFDKAEEILAEAERVLGDNNEEIKKKKEEIAAAKKRAEEAMFMPTPSPEPTNTPIPSPTPTEEPTPSPMPTDAPEQTSVEPWVHITKTEIRADSVFNTEGYGSLIIRGNDRDSVEWDEWIPAQVALIDNSGAFCFSYREDTVGDYFSEDARFRCSDGIVSLTIRSATSEANSLPLYYHLDGSNAFVLEESEREYVDENGRRWSETTSYQGGPLTDGYAVVVKRKALSSLDNYLAGGATTLEYVTCVVDENGTFVCELPSEDNEVLQFGAGGVTTRKSLGWCGEGLIGFINFTESDNAWYLAITEIGYMDPSGQTVIDLTGQGYVSTYPFNNGLAAVRSEEGKYGFIDKTGTLVIPCVYDIFSGFGNDGLCAVKKDGKWGYIDKSGNTVIPFEYDVAFSAESRLAAVGKDGKYGLVDYDNHVVVPLEFDDISTYENGVAYAIKDGTVYIITQDDAISSKD